MNEQQLIDAGIPKRYLHASLNDFQAMQEVRDFIFNESHWTKIHIKHISKDIWRDDVWRVLFVGGNIGTGKTHLICAIAAAYGAKSSIRYTTAYDMSQGIMQARNADIYKKASLLVIDEIGRGFETDAERKRFFDVVDCRYSNCKPLVIAGNIKRAQLREAVGDAIADRFNERFDFITLAGNSRRG